MADPPSLAELLKDAKKMEELVVACNRCGFCTSTCPTYLSTGSESHSPRGRNQAFRALLEGKVTRPAEIKDIVDTCLLCGECTSVCFSEVPVADIMIASRHLMNQFQGVPKILRFILQRMLPKPKWLGVLLRIGYWSKALGLVWMARKTGLLKRISPSLAEAEGLMKNVPLRLLSDRPAAQPYLERSFHKEEFSVMVAKQKVEKLERAQRRVPEKLLRKSQIRPRRPKVAFMTVCGGQYIRPSISMATIKLLKRVGVEFMIPELFCCGLPGASYGALENVKHLARENLTRLEWGKYDAIIVDDSSCAAHIKEYPRFFIDDPVWYGRAQVISQRVRELSHYLLQKGLTGFLKGVIWKKKGTLAYHDPCKAQYAQKITQPPRELLAAIPGLNLVPIAHPDQCCGGGGTYRFVHPGLSRDILARKVDNIIRSNCQTVVTSSTSCLIQLESGLRENGSSIAVRHLAEFLAEVLDDSESA